MAAEQPEPGGGTDVAPDPGRDFAALMSSAAEAAAPPPSEAPFGYTVDRKTGERRPKAAAGRPRKSPSMDELRAARTEKAGTGPGTTSPGPDVAPDTSRRRKKAAVHDSDDDAGKGIKDGPGVITKGVNRLYRRAGKIVKAMDRDIGIAVIEATRNSADKGEPDDSVGAAWEEVCRTNPRIRRFILRVLAGGAWGQLVMAHAPILLAIILKDGIRKHLPMAKLFEAFLSDDDDTEADGEGDGEKGGLAGLMGDMTPGDLQQMAQLAQNLMGGMAAKAAA